MSKMSSEILNTKDISVPQPSAVLNGWSFRDAHHIPEVEAMNISGSGVRVGIADGGVDFGNPNLDGKYTVFNTSQLPSSSLADNANLSYYNGWPMAFDPSSMSSFLSTGTPEGSYYVDTSESGTGPFESTHKIKLDGMNDFGVKERAQTDSVKVDCPEATNHFDYDLTALYGARDANNWYFGFPTQFGEMNRSFAIYLDLDGPQYGSIYDPTGNFVNFNSSHSNIIQQIKTSPDGNHVASCALPGLINTEDKNKVRIWATDGSYIDLEHTGDVLSMTWSPDSQLLATATTSKLYIWYTNNWTIKEQKDISLTPPAGFTNLLSFNSNGRLIALTGVGGSGRVQIFNLTTDTFVNFAAVSVRDIQFSPTEPNWLLYSSGSELYVRDTATASTVRFTGGHTVQISSVSWSPDGNSIVSADTDGKIVVWDASDLGTNWADHDFTTFGLWTKDAHAAGLDRQVVAWKGDTIISGADDGIILGWNSSTGSETNNMTIPSLSAVKSLDFSGNNIISASLDGTIRFWLSNTTYDIYYAHKPDLIITMDYISEKAESFPDTISSPTVYKWDGAENAWDSYSIYDAGGDYAYSSLIKNYVISGFVELMLPREFAGGSAINGIQAELLSLGNNRPQDSVPRDRSFNGRTETNFTFEEQIPLSNFATFTIHEYKVNSADIASKSGSYHFGIHTSDIMKKTYGSLGVLVADENIAGQYDTVYVDLNNDYVFDANDVRLNKTHPTATYDRNSDGVPDISAGTLYFISHATKITDESLVMNGTSTKLAQKAVDFPGDIEIKKNGVPLTETSNSETIMNIADEKSFNLLHGNLASLKISGNYIPVVNETILKSSGGYDNEPIQLAHHDTLSDDVSIVNCTLYGLIYTNTLASPQFQKISPDNYTIDLGSGSITLTDDFVDSFSKGTEIYAFYNYTGLLYDGSDFSFTAASGSINLAYPASANSVYHVDYTYLPWIIDESTGTITMTDDPLPTDTFSATYEASGVPIPYSDIYAKRHNINNVIPGNGDVVCFMGDFEYDYTESHAISHGTEMASAIASTTKGVAKNVTLLPVMNAGDSLQDAWYFLVEGYDGITNTGDESNIVYSGITSAPDGAGIDTLSQTMDYIIYDYTNKSTPFVTPAGDGGYGYGTLSAPSASGAIVVGAASDNALLTETGNLHHYGDVALYSSRGPSLTGNKGPDVIAVGTGEVDSILNYACSAETADGTNAEMQVQSSDLSAAVVTGIISLIADAYRNAASNSLDSEMARDILCSGAEDRNYDPFSQGSGFANAKRSVKIAMNIDGILTSPNSWKPGTSWSEGTDVRQEFPAFPNALFAGQSETEQFTLKSSSAQTVQLSTQQLQVIGEYDYNFVTTGTTYKNTSNILSYIPSNTTLLRITASAEITKNIYSSAYSLRILDWKDTNGDGIVQDTETNTMTHDSFEYGGRNVLQTTIYNPLQRAHDGILVKISPDNNNGVNKLGWNVSCEFYVQKAWNWVTVPSSISATAGTTSTFDATLNIPSTANVGVYEGAIVEKYSPQSVIGESISTADVTPATTTRILDASATDVVNENVSMTDSTHGQLAHGNITYLNLWENNNTFNNDTVDYTTDGTETTPWGFYLPHGNITNVPSGNITFDSGFLKILVSGDAVYNATDLGWFWFDNLTGYVNFNNTDWDDPLGTYGITEFYAFYSYKTALNEPANYSLDTSSGNITLTTALDTTKWLTADYGWYTPLSVQHISLTHAPIYNITVFINSTEMIKDTDYTLNYTSGNLTVIPPSTSGYWTLYINYTWYIDTAAYHPRTRLSHTPIVPGSVTLYEADGSVINPIDYAVDYESGVVSILNGTAAGVTADYEYYTTTLIPVSLIVANKGIRMETGSTTELTPYTNVVTRGGFQTYSLDKTGDWRYFYLEAPKQGLIEGPPANLKFITDVDWRTDSTLYPATGGPDDVGISLSSGAATDFYGYNVPVKGQTTEMNVTDVVAYVRYKSDVAPPASARPDQIHLVYKIGSTEGESDYTAVPTAEYTTAEISLTNDREWTVRELNDLRFTVSMEQIGAPDTWHLIVDSVWLDVKYYIEDSDYDIRVFAPTSSTLPESQTIAPYAFHEVASTSEPSPYEKFVISDLTPGITIIAIRSTAINGTISTEDFKLQTGTIEIPNTPINVYTNNRQGSAPFALKSDIELPGMGASVVGPASVTTYPNLEIHYDKHAVEDVAAVDFIQAMAISGFTLPIEVKNAASVYFHVIPHSDVNDVDLGIFYDANGDGVAQKNEFVTNALVPRIATDGWGGFDPFPYAYSADWDADEGVTLYDPPDGTYLVKVLGFDIAGEVGHIDVDVSMIIAGIKGFEITSLHDGPIKPYEPAYLSVGWSFANDAEDKTYNGVLYMGTNTFPDSIMAPLKITLDTASPTIDKISVGSTEIKENVPLTAEARSPISAIYSDSQTGVSKATMKVDGNDVTLFASISDSSISWTPKTALADGTHSIEISLEDAAGNTMNKSAFFIVDTTAPYIQVAESGSVYTNSDVYTITGSVERASSLLVNDQSVEVTEDGSFSTDVSLVEGENMIMLRATDATGNTATKEVSIIYDTTPPEISATIQGPSLTNDPLLVVRGTVNLLNELGPVTMTINGEPVDVHHDGTFSSAVTLNDGTQTIEIRATDAAGNTATTDLTGTLDREAPTLSVTSIPGISHTSRITVSGNAEPGSRVYVNGKQVITTNGAFDTTVLISNGANVITVEATDAAGNTVQQTFSVTYEPDEELSASRITANAQAAPALTSTAAMLLVVVAIIFLLIGFIASKFMKKGGEEGGAAAVEPVQEIPVEEEAEPENEAEVPEPGEEKVEEVMEAEEAEDISDDIIEEAITEQETEEAAEPLEEGPFDLGSAIEQGKELLAAGDNVRAMEIFEKAIENAPGEIEGYLGKAQALDAAGKWGQALQIINKALEVNPQATEALELKGDIFAGQGKTEMARSAYEQALEIEPGNTDIRNKLSKLD